MMRHHLGMEIGILSEYSGGELLFRAIDAPDHESLIRMHMTWPVEASLCAAVLKGDAPAILPDTAEHPLVRDLPMVQTFGIRAVLALPLSKADGGDYGTLCFLSTRPEPMLTGRDLGAVRMFAHLVEREVQRRTEAEDARIADRDVIEALISQRQFEVYAQPIIDLRTRAFSGYEALSRFDGFPDLPAETVFDLASAAGMRAQLESEIIKEALDGVDGLRNGGYLSVNAAPTTVFAPGFETLFAGHNLSRVILEMTEHQQVRDYPALLALLAPLREQGLRIAVDDAGTGFSGLHQIVQLQPDMIKLDRALVSGIDGDQAKRAMCAAMVHYAGESGAFLVAEGVETLAEADELIRLGVSHGQGYHFGRPLPLKALSAA